jgi:serine/threonine-protein kinase
VAIKALAPSVALDQRAVARFRREARRVAALAHPHIAPLHRVIELDDRLYVVMPLFTESLRDRLARTPRLELKEAVRIASQIGAALAAAHVAGLIHRDVKPGNILLDEHGDAYLADFGVACRALSEDETESSVSDSVGCLVGTPRYMAPEQFRAERLDARADIYALAVVLYQMLTGQTPHSGNSLVAVASAALTDPVTPPSALSALVPAEVDAVILRALSKKPTDRYSTAGQFVAALADAMRSSGGATTQSVMAALKRNGPQLWPHRPVRDRPVSRHNRWIPWALTALLLLVALLSGGASLLTGVTGSAQGPGSSARLDGSALQRHALPTAAAPSTTQAPTAPTPASSVTPSAQPSQSTATPSTPRPTTTPPPRQTATPSLPQPTATHGPHPTQTPLQPSPSPQPTVTPLPQPTATPPGPSTATPPAPQLGAQTSLLSAGSLHLTKSHGEQCSGVLTITNQSAQPMKWQWEAVQAPLHPSFHYGVNAPAEHKGLPADQDPGVAPHAQDVVNIRMKCTGQTYQVTLRDGFGRTQQLTWTSDD